MIEDQVDAGELGEWLGVTARRVRQLAQEGLVEKTGRGRYALRASVRMYLGWIQAKASTTLIDSGSSEAKNQEAVALARVRRKLAEEELAQRRKETVPRDEAERALISMAAGVRATFLGLPAKLAVELAGEDDPQEIRRRLEEEIRQTLFELAEAGEKAEARARQVSA